jgi:hypothetical protein
MSGTVSPTPSGPSPTKGSGPAPTKKPGKGTKGPSLTSADLVPVWLDVDTVKFLIRTLTAALNQIQPKKGKKSGKK